MKLEVSLGSSTIQNVEHSSFNLFLPLLGAASLQNQDELFWRFLFMKQYY